MASAPIRLCFLTVRVSRGVSALGPVNSLGLGPAPSSRLAANPGNEIEIRLSCFCFPTLRQRAPVPASFRLIVTDSSSGVFFSGMPPTETGDPRVSRRTRIASANRLRTRGLFRPTHARDDLPLTPLSRSSLRYRVVPFAVHVGPIRRGSPRPLPPRRREATKFFPVQSAFVRRELRCSSSALSSGDCAPSAPWICLRELLLGSRATLADDPSRHLVSVVLRTPPAGNQSSCRLRLPPPRIASQRRASFGKRGPPGTADSTWNDWLHP